MTCSTKNVSLSMHQYFIPTLETISFVGYIALLTSLLSHATK